MLLEEVERLVEVNLGGQGTARVSEVLKRNM